MVAQHNFAHSHLSCDSLLLASSSPFCLKKLPFAFALPLSQYFYGKAHWHRECQAPSHNCAEITLLLVWTLIILAHPHCSRLSWRRHRDVPSFSDRKGLLRISFDLLFSVEILESLTVRTWAPSSKPFLLVTSVGSEGIRRDQIYY